MLILGERKGKIGLEMPAITLTDSIPGKLYYLLVKTKGSTTNEKSLATELMSQLLTKFKAKVTYMSITDGQVEVQLEGSPFAWAAVIAWLPTILTLFGLTLIGIAVYTVFASIPSWAWGLLAIGIGFIVFAPSVGKMIKVR